MGYKLPPKFSAKAAVSRALLEAGGPQAVAARMQRRRSVLYAYGDPDHPTHAPFDAICALVEAGALSPVHHLAALAGGSFVAGEAPREKFSALFARAARMRGELDAETCAALADGVIDAGERSGLAEAFGEQIAALTAARARLLAGEDPQ